MERWAKDELRILLHVPPSTLTIFQKNIGLDWFDSFGHTASGLKWPPAARQLSPVSPTAWTWSPCNPALSPNTLPWILTWSPHFVWMSIRKLSNLNLHTCSMLMVPVTPLLDSSVTLAVGTPRSTAVQSKRLSEN